MIKAATDYHQIVNLFNKYIEHKKSRVLTMVGFSKYLLKEHEMPAWLVRNLRLQIKFDPNLSFHLNMVLEDFIVTGMLTGTIKESGAKLILKNQFGYVENPDANSHETDAKIKQITYRPAVLEDIPNAG